MSHVSSSDSLNGRRTSSDSGKDPEGPGGLSAPSDPAGPRLSPERRGSGSGPVVARRKSSDTGKERRSCSSLSEKETAESPVSNGCINRWSDTHHKHALHPVLILSDPGGDTISIPGSSCI